MSIAVVSLLTACGYTVHPSLDARYQTIHVAPFKNESREFDLQVPITNAVIRRFMMDSRLRIVSSGQADLIVNGTILDGLIPGSGRGVQPIACQDGCPS